MRRQLLHRGAVARHRPQRERFQAMYGHHTEVGAGYAWRASGIQRTSRRPLRAGRKTTGKSGESSPTAPGGVLFRVQPSRVLADIAGNGVVNAQDLPGGYAAPHDGRRPGRGQEGAGCQRRFPVITARSMECSSEPGVIAAGLQAASFREPGAVARPVKRTHRPRHRAACLALLAATALLVPRPRPRRDQTTTVTRSPGDRRHLSQAGCADAQHGRGRRSRPIPIRSRRTSGSLPQNEYFGFTSDAS